MSETDQELIDRARRIPGPPEIDWPKYAFDPMHANDPIFRGLGGTLDLKVNRYVEAPIIYVGDGPAVFLAGGITGADDWQFGAADRLNLAGLDVLNPRRVDFPIGDPNAALEQIVWEFDHLRVADVILFWFPASAPCPIVLFELGYWLSQHTPLAIGVEPGYVREQDVKIQTGLVRRDLQVFTSLTETVSEAIRLSRGLR